MYTCNISYMNRIDVRLNRIRCKQIFECMGLLSQCEGFFQLFGSLRIFAEQFLFI